MFRVYTSPSAHVRPFPFYLTGCSPHPPSGSARCLQDWLVRPPWCLGFSSAPSVVANPLSLSHVLPHFPWFRKLLSAAASGAFSLHHGSATPGLLVLADFFLILPCPPPRHPGSTRNVKVPSYHEWACGDARALSGSLFSWTSYSSNFSCFRISWKMCVREEQTFLYPQGFSGLSNNQIDTGED